MKWFLILLLFLMISGLVAWVREDEDIDPVRRTLPADIGAVTAYDTHRPLPQTEDEWKTRLTPEAYAVLRGKSTECAFTGAYYKHKEEGIYLCAGCGHPLFAAKDKFRSGTGWPSYLAPLHEDSVSQITDRSHGMIRTEVLCRRCDSHLGHVFDDGPAPTGKRYCINSIALQFHPSEQD